MEEGTVFVVGFLVEISGKERPRSWAYTTNAWRLNLGNPRRLIITMPP